MARKRFSNKDFDVKNLPKTRKEQYKDLLQTEYRTLIMLGLTLLVFAMPILFIYFAKDYSVSKIITSMISEELSKEQGISSLFSTYLIYDLLETMTLVVLFIGLSGAYRVYRVLLWNEGLFFKEDFIQGIKTNSLRFSLNAIILGICIFGMDLSATILYNYSTYSNIISGIVVLISLFIVIPLVLFNLAQEAIYNNSIINTLINSFKLTISNYPKMLLFALPFSSIYFIENVPNRILILVICVAIIVFLLPLYLAKSMTFSLDLFDKLLNNDLKEIKDKGLYK